MMRIKTERSVQLMESVCDFTEAVESPAEPVNDDPTSPVPVSDENNKMVAKPDVIEVDVITSDQKDVGCSSNPEKESILNTCKEDRSAVLASKKKETAKKIASVIKNPSVLRTQTHKKGPKPPPASASASARREASLKKIIAAANLALENQAIKKQKLEGGKSRQILNIKPTNLQHKNRFGTYMSSSSSSVNREKDRKIYVREPAPFVSTAEMMRKFQSGGTRSTSLSTSLDNNGGSSIAQRRSNTKLTLTRPKEPELVTSQRIRSARIKSSSEIEEEMMATIPKFKARPLNKKIFEASNLPPIPRTTPRQTQFHEFRLETSARAVTTLESSSSSAQHIDQSKPRLLTTPKPPILQTSLRARPVSVKSFDQIEKEELEKAPKFKARPINRKIFESKGDIGMLFCNSKKQVTVPDAFHFRIDERIPLPVPPTDLFGKMSILCSEADKKQGIVRNTRQNPFNLMTEERGAEKEKMFAMEMMIKEQEDERVRIKKALPYPYTTDYPAVLPKPEVKQCTKPEPFRLESLVRHEEEMQKKIEEKMRMEKEEYEMRLFKAQPIMKEDPMPVREKARIPLTDVQGFNLQVQNRAVDRAEFDKKIKEKEQMYKRYREEEESAKMMEEEKALKQLRRTLKPHARPVPNFSHPFLPQKSKKETTKAKSPKLQNGRKEIRTSCAASNMR
ncbi:protein TPX2-like isoform X2 [Impatiens glandulifera]|nr:protein TPX2-like isoform X2 [Impatiens glandulifera]